MAKKHTRKDMEDSKKKLEVPIKEDKSEEGKEIQKESESEEPEIEEKKETQEEPTRVPITGPTFRTPQMGGYGRPSTGQEGMARHYPRTRHEEGMKSRVPVLIKILAILYFIIAMIGIATGIVLLAGFENLLENFPGFDLIGDFLIVGGIGFLVIGLICFIIGLGLLRRKNWARILAIIVSALILIFTIFFIGTIGSIISIAVNGLIVLYLIFSRRVKRAFGK